MAARSTPPWRSCTRAITTRCDLSARFERAGRFTAAAAPRPRGGDTLRSGSINRVTVAPAVLPCSRLGRAVVVRWTHFRTGRGPHPLDPTFINAYRHFDPGSSGTSSECDTKTSDFTELAVQLRRRGFKGYITKSALASHYGMRASCLEFSTEATMTPRANSDAILGITCWGGGRIWPEITFSKMTRQRPPGSPSS